MKGQNRSEESARDPKKGQETRTKNKIDKERAKDPKGKRSGERTRQSKKGQTIRRKGKRSKKIA